MQIVDSERISKEYLFVNNCGKDLINEKDTYWCKPSGRVDYHILYISKGCCYVTLNGSVTKAPAGSVVVFLPGQRQEYSFKKADQSVSWYLHYTGTACEQIMADLELESENIFYVGKSPRLEELFQTLMEEFQRKQKFNKHYQMGVLMEILSVIARKKSDFQYGNPATSKKIDEICKCMRRDISKNPSILEYANMCNLSESRFAHVFTELVGTSPKHYMMILKMEMAKELLLQSNLSVQQVSESIGINDQNYFSRTFKKYVGYSPTEYMKLY